MLGRLIRLAIVGLMVSITIALFATQYSYPTLRDSLQPRITELLAPYPELTGTLDGRDISVVADAGRRIPKDTADVLSGLMQIEGVRAVSFSGGNGLANTLDLADPQLADAPIFDPNTIPVVDLSTGIPVDFSAVIQFVIAPTWRRSLQDDPCILSFGNLQTTEFAICLSGDRKNLTLQNENDFAYIPHDFTADKPYIVEVVVNDKLAEVFVDGESAGTGSVGFIGPSVQQLNVGSYDGVSSIFEGHIGRIRVWNRGDREGLSDMKVPGVDPVWVAWAPGFSKHHDNLVAFSSVGKDGALTVKVLPKRTDPIGVWYVPDEAAIRRMDKEELQGAHLNWLGETPEKGHHGNYTSFKILRISRIPNGDLEIWSDEGGSNDIWGKRDWTKAEWLSRRTDTWYGTWPIDRIPPMTVFRSRPLLSIDDGEALVLDDQVRLMPFTFKEPNAGAQKDQNDAWESTFVNPEQIKNWFYSFAGYDITRMNPINFGDLEGVRAPVFARPGPDNLDYKSTGEGRFAPAQLYFKPIFQAETENTVEISNTELELQQSHARSLGANIGLEGAGSFGGSYTMSTKLENLRASKFETGYGETRVLHYALVEDKARMLLSPSFEAGVESLVLRVVERKMADGKTRLEVEGQPDRPLPSWVRSAGPILAGPESFRAFIEKFGTHYPYAITYGGKVHVEFQKRGITTQSSKEESKEMKLEAEGVLEGVKLGGSFSTTKGNGIKSGSENGTEITKTVVVGGRGSGSLDGFEIQDTVVPIYTDLRPLSELLSPLYFDDAFVTGDVRAALADAIADYRSHFVLSDVSNSLRVSLRIHKLTCVDDGDDTFSVGFENVTATNKLGDLNQILDGMSDFGQSVAGLFGAKVEDSADQADTCELRGNIGAVLLKGDEIIDTETGEPAKTDGGSVMRWSLTSTKDLAALTKPFVANWRADRDGGSNPLLIPEGDSFALTTSNKEAELNFIVPRAERDKYRIGIVGDLYEVDPVTYSKKDKVIKTDYFTLNIRQFESLELPKGQNVRNWSLAASGTCTPNKLVTCSQAPFSAEIAGTVRVEVDVSVQD